MCSTVLSMAYRKRYYKKSARRGRGKRVKCVKYVYYR